jgi:hypothetical protein
MQFTTLFKAGLLAGVLSVPSACCPVRTVKPVEPPPVVEPPVPDAPVVHDAAVEVPESGFWERTAPGAWTYDLGVGLTSDIQLTAPGNGRGIMRVQLPPNAASARVTAIRVMYAKNHADMPEPDGAASGEVVWHIHADDNGKPGAELGMVAAMIQDSDAAPLEDANDGVVHPLVTSVEVPPTFWLVFERRSGNPRVAAMVLGESLQGTYADLFFTKEPGDALGQPTNYRPYISLMFVDMRAK